MECYGLETDRETNEKVEIVPIKNIRLLYKLADANLLHYLIKVGKDWNDPSRKVWLFEKSSYVIDEINAFYIGDKYKKHNKNGGFTK